MSTVSVIVPTYRRDWALRRALESLSTQTYSAFEVIVVDDNDNCEWNTKVKDIISEFVNNHPQIPIQYIQNHPNIGSAKSRNVGIDSAKGQYVCFLDDDDVYLSDRIINQLLPMQNANADYGITDLALFLDDGSLAEIRRRTYIKDLSLEALFKYHMMYHMTGTDTMMFRLEYLLDIGKFSPIDIGDEFYLMQKAIEGNGRFLYTSVCDVQAYIHNEKVGLSGGLQKIAGENQLFKHKMQYFDCLEKKCVRYIKMRHYAVIAFAYLRMKEYVKFIKCCVLSCISAPYSCLSLFLRRLLMKQG